MYAVESAKEYDNESHRDLLRWFWLKVDGFCHLHPSNKDDLRYQLKIDKQDIKQELVRDVKWKADLKISRYWLRSKTSRKRNIVWQADFKTMRYRLKRQDLELSKCFSSGLRQKNHCNCSPQQGGHLVVWLAVRVVKMMILWLNANGVNDDDDDDILPHRTSKNQGHQLLRQGVRKPANHHHHYHQPCHHPCSPPHHHMLHRH